jgi:hypothetical protein
VDEWRELLGTIVTAVESPTTNTLRMRLADGAGTDALVALAQQEVACCPFFSFALEIDALGLVLTASVPPEAAPVLEGFAQLAAR